MNVWSFFMVAQMWRVCLLGRLGTVGGLWEDLEARAVLVSLGEMQ
jgi:hypothetical protein